MKEFNIKGRKGAFDMPPYYSKEFTNDAIEKVNIFVKIRILISRHILV